MDAIIGIFNNPIVLTGVGLLVKYVPALKGIPNLLIPFLTALLAFVSQIVAPAEAHAAGGPLVITAVPFLSFLGPVGSALWQSVQAGLIHEFFLRHPLAAAGIKKAA